LRKTKRKKMAAMTKIIFQIEEKPNERWSMDFATDSIVTRRHFRTLLIVDIPWPMARVGVLTNIL
jgi:putative transposase